MKAHVADEVFAGPSGAFGIGKATWIYIGKALNGPQRIDVSATVAFRAL